MKASGLGKEDVYLGSCIVLVYCVAAWAQGTTGTWRILDGTRRDGM